MDEESVAFRVQLLRSQVIHPFDKLACVVVLFLYHWMAEMDEESIMSLISPILITPCYRLLFYDKISM